MNCEQFLGALEALAGCETLPDQVLQHTSSCAACERKLAHARNLVALLRKLPIPVAPPGLRSRVLAGVSADRVAPVRPIYRRRLAQVAAAAILLIGVSVTHLVVQRDLVQRDPGLSYQSLELTVLPMAESGTSDEEFALEVMYGPGIPIGEFQDSEDSGGEESDGDAPGSADDR